MMAYGTTGGRSSMADGASSPARVHLIGRISLNRAVYVNIAIAIVIVGGWLFPGVQAVLVGLLRDRTLDATLMFFGIAMPLFFGSRCVRDLLGKLSPIHHRPGRTARFHGASLRSVRSL